MSGGFCSQRYWGSGGLVGTYVNMWKVCYFRGCGVRKVCCDKSVKGVEGAVNVEGVVYEGGAYRWCGL